MESYEWRIASVAGKVGGKRIHIQVSDDAALLIANALEAVDPDSIPACCAAESIALAIQGVLGE
jgi:hypothetical protein